MLEDFAARTFSERLGDTFIVRRGAEDPVKVEIVSVEKPGGGSEGRPFSVVFRGSSGLPLSQGTHRMEHARIGDFELFLVPIGRSPDGEGFLYEAVFN